MPLSKDWSLSQQVWVDRERRKPESAMQQHGPIEEVTEVSMGLEMALVGKLRQWKLQERKTHPHTQFVGELPIGPPQLNLGPGKVRVYVAQESEDGVIKGWVEKKRTAEEMADSLMVSARDAIRKRQDREIYYLQAGRRSQTFEDEKMIVEVTPGERWNLRESTTPLVLGPLISQY